MASPLNAYVRLQMQRQQPSGMPERNLDQRNSISQRRRARQMDGWSHCSAPAAGPENLGPKICREFSRGKEHPVHFGAPSGLRDIGPIPSGTSVVFLCRHQSCFFGISPSIDATCSSLLESKSRMGQGQIRIPLFPAFEASRLAPFACWRRAAPVSVLTIGSVEASRDGRRPHARCRAGDRRPS
jgi:hypothetical protein